MHSPSRVYYDFYGKMLIAKNYQIQSFSEFWKFGVMTFGKFSRHLLFPGFDFRLVAKKSWHLYFWPILQNFFISEQMCQTAWWGQFHQHFWRQSRAASGQIIFIWFYVTTGCDKKLQKYRGRCKSCSLKYAIKFWQKCWHNIKSFFCKFVYTVAFAHWAN